ncbi:MAG: tRNA (N(6)-L-threonylcarbamoyladenosine(37)-C(2))-methylthiotransferase MtaB [Clostridia bacterium]|nr:tRNA (N(6)-L-threonylcarbamoyladenosine(37)-C(2))-methylthiotransferase MtaB [Clostridia bacterium]
MSGDVCKTVAVYTLGCKVNQYESEAILEAFEQRGFIPAAPEDVCDVYVINTCTVTAESDRKARQFIRRAIHRNPNACILVTGCLAQTAPENIAAIAGVDFICGNADKMSVVEAAEELLRKAEKAHETVIHVNSLEGAGFEPMCITRFDRTRAYVKIEDGCESRCTYCIIPEARGKIRSKPIPEVLDEVRGLIAGGCREVVLTGIETASYGKDLHDSSLAELLIAIDRLEGIGRVRLGSLDPSLLKPAFVNAIAPLRSLCPHFHISMQSGSSSVLARMKRKYNADQALAGMQRLREVMPQVQFTTDIIVGFPQETEEEFEQTLDFVKKAGFLMIHVFPYSKRRGTPAAIMSGQVPEDVKRRRTATLIAHAAEIRRDILQRLIDEGEEHTVLFESFENGRAWGHTSNFIEVAIDSDKPLHAQTLPVRLYATDGTRCFAKPTVS